jgi:CBS domain-containing protein
MKIIKQLLQSKGSEVWSVEPDTKVFEALQLMADKNIGALLVTEGEKLVGIISERDYARKVILHKKSSTDVPVKEIMTSKVYCIAPDTSIQECMAVMTEQRIRHLPVLEEDEKLVGVISIGDVVKAIISEQEFMIEQLQNYIVGGA